MQLEHPLKVFYDWLLSQPEEVRSSTAILTAPHLSDPRFRELAFFATAPTSQFEEWLLEQRQLEMKQAIAQVLSLRALVQFFVIEHFESEAQWKKIEEAHTESISEFEEQGYDAEVTEPLERIVRSAPFRQRQWAKAAKSWSALVNGPLSNEQLRIWLLMDHGEAKRGVGSIYPNEYGKTDKYAILVGNYQPATHPENACREAAYQHPSNRKVSI